MSHIIAIIYVTTTHMLKCKILMCAESKQISLKIFIAIFNGNAKSLILLSSPLSLLSVSHMFTIGNFLKMNFHIHYYNTQCIELIATVTSVSTPYVHKWQNLKTNFHIHYYYTQCIGLIFSKMLNTELQN